MAAALAACCRIPLVACQGCVKGCAACTRTCTKLCTRCCRGSSKAIKKAGKKGRRGGKKGRRFKRSNSEGGDTIIMEASDSSSDDGGGGGWFGESADGDLPPLMLKMDRDGPTMPEKCAECGDKLTPAEYMLERV